MNIAGTYFVFVGCYQYAGLTDTEKITLPVFYKMLLGERYCKIMSLKFRKFQDKCRLMERAVI